jgi:hypothetical protein
MQEQKGQGFRTFRSDDAGARSALEGFSRDVCRMWFGRQEPPREGPADSGEAQDFDLWSKCPRLRSGAKRPWATLLASPIPYLELHGPEAPERR